VIGGIGARLAMRAVVLLEGGQPALTAGGTLGILVLGAVLGALGGLGFAAVRRVLRLSTHPPAAPLRSLLAGLGYGAALAVLAVLPFFTAPTGEFGLAPPLVGATLFAWIPLAYGLALGGAVPWLERRLATAERSVGAGWLAAFGLAMALALAGMTPLLGMGASFPPLMTDLHRALGLGFQSAQLIHRGIMLLFIVFYCALAGWIFWRGSQERAGRLTAVALLVFAAGFFGRKPALAGSMQATPLVDVLPALLQAGGLSLMLAVFLSFPDGRLALPWSRPLLVGWCAWALVWFVNPVPNTALDVSTWPESALMLVLAAGFGCGLAAVATRVRESPPDERRQSRPVFWGGLAVVTGFGLLWLASLALPGLRLRGAPLPTALLAFGPYLLFWLILPLAFVAAIRRGLWAAK
jgi:hypothetical protein